jgi:antitoxin component HigA of HigAB toxin-antitoxin module
MPPVPSMRYFPIILLSLLLSQCRPDHASEPPSVEVTVEDAFIRYIGIPEDQLSLKLDSILDLDHSFTELFNGVILGGRDSFLVRDRVFDWFTDTARTGLKDRCMQVFESMDWQKSMGIPFAKYKQAFPERTVPVIHTLITDFNYGIFLFRDDLGRDALGIGLEMFMGDTRLYDQLSIQNPNFSSYLNRTFNLSHLPSKIIHALISDLIPEPSGNRLLDHIIREGKILYITQSLMPGIADTILHEYTSDQMRWVIENEWDIWRFLLSEKLLYQSAGKDIINLVQPAPHSQGMPPEAPGRAVNTVGLKIIKAFMQRENLSLSELAGKTDADEILQKARYRPG